jgi:hypothetical protein
MIAALFEQGFEVGGLRARHRIIPRDPVVGRLSVLEFGAGSILGLLSPVVITRFPAEAAVPGLSGIKTPKRHAWFLPVGILGRKAPSKSVIAPIVKPGIASAQRLVVYARLTVSGAPALGTGGPAGCRRLFGYFLGRDAAS